MKKIIGWLVLIAILSWFFKLCSPAGVNKTGHEYMPDMVHPVSYEANQNSSYYWNHWDAKSVFTKEELSRPRKSVNGTIARGYTGVSYAGAAQADIVRGKNAPNAIAAPMNGAAPYYYGNTDEERARAIKEITSNPFPIEKTKIEGAKAVYNTYCGICHGEKANGAGYLARDGSAYPLAPPSFMTDEFIGSSDGRFMHAIMYGKGKMGSYAEKLSFEERWQVIHYIRSLQAQSKNVPYDANWRAGLKIVAPAPAAAPLASPTAAPAVKKN